MRSKSAPLASVHCKFTCYFVHNREVYRFGLFKMQELNSTPSNLRIDLIHIYKLFTHTHTRAPNFRTSRSLVKARACTNTPNYIFNMRMRKVDYFSWEYGNYYIAGKCNRLERSNERITWNMKHGMSNIVQEQQQRKKKKQCKRKKCARFRLMNSKFVSSLTVCLQIEWKSPSNYEKCERMNSERSHRMSSKWHSKRTKAGCQVVLVMILRKLNMSLLRP